MDGKQSAPATTSTVTGTDQASQQNATQRERKDVERQQSQENRIARGGAYPFMNPFALLQRIFSDDIARIFEEPGARTVKRKAQSRGVGDVMMWSPKVDVVQRGNELVVRADLPGVNPDDVAVEITDDAIVLSGQRMQEQVEEEGGVYRLERSCGAFFREIPLPQGAIVDQAKATFKNGVLEITVPAPSEQVSRGRRVEISKEGS
jgi:HSP20 family protein